MKPNNHAGGFKPLLAASLPDLSTIQYPVYASRKLDGVRAVIKDGVVLSRSLKPIRNRNVQWLFGRPELNHLDGELIVGNPAASDVYRTTTSVVNRADALDDVRFYVFDDFSKPDSPYLYRRIDTAQRAAELGVKVIPVFQTEIHNEAELLEYESISLGAGFEGVMLRSLNGTYKFGRSTLNEGILLKLKRFSDSEAEIIGMVEKMHNENVATVNELGRTARSTAKAGLVPAGTLGALMVRDIHSGVEFEIGTGFDDATRAQLWKDRPIGELVKYKFFAVGDYDKPRFPVFLGMRDKGDL